MLFSNKFVDFVGSIGPEVRVPSGLTELLNRERSQMNLSEQPAVTSLPVHQRSVDIPVLIREAVNPVKPGS